MKDVFETTKRQVRRYTPSLKADYRIQREDGTFLNAGTDSPSWFDLDSARLLVNRSAGERVVESDGVNILWEVF